MNNQEQNIIIYNSEDGRARVALMTRDGNVWLNQNQMAELFATSKQNIGQLISKILKEKELDPNSVVKYYFTTASDGKQYNVLFYSLEMILANSHRQRKKMGICPTFKLRATSNTPIFPLIMQKNADEK